MNNEDLIQSALNDDEPEIVEAVEEPEQQIEGQPRDEGGRFAQKVQSEPDPAAAEQPAKEEGYVPSWRLREQTERAEAADRRASQLQADFERRFNELQSRLPKPEPAATPDVFDDPNKFLEHGVRQAVDPIKGEISQIREYYSQKEAVREHGSEKVKAAYDAIAQGVQSRDPEAMATYQRAMSSMDPYGDIVKWHQQKTIYSQIGNDPNAWARDKWLKEQLSDPKSAGEILQMIQSQARGNTVSPTQISIPRSISRIPAAHSSTDEPGGMSNADLISSNL